jgi:cell division protein FtsL
MVWFLVIVTLLLLMMVLVGAMIMDDMQKEIQQLESDLATEKSAHLLTADDLMKAEPYRIRS